MPDAASHPLYEELLKEKEFVNAVLESIDDGIVACNAEGQLTIFNHATRVFHGLEPEVMPKETLASHYGLYLADGITPMTEKDIPLLRVLQGEQIKDVEMVIKVEGRPDRILVANGRTLRDNNKTVIGAVVAMHDITKEKASLQKLKQLNERLAKSREEERLHISREIHDDSIQNLIGINYGLASLQRSNPNEASVIKALRQDVLSVIRQLRGVISDLRPAALDEFGFEAALEGFISKLHRSRKKQMPNISLDVPIGIDFLSQSILICLFRAAQESLNNILKHAKANQVSIKLALTETQVSMTIHDDGKGFIVPSFFEELVKDSHFGLAGIEERVKLLDGDLQVQSEINLGTQIFITLPRSDVEYESHYLDE